MSTEEIDKLQSLVQQAVGYQAERGDTISVVNTLFSDADQDKGTHFLEKYDLIEMAFSLIKYLLLALLFFAVWRIVIQDRKSTRLNSSHVAISYAVFCLKK